MQEAKSRSIGSFRKEQAAEGRKVLNSEAGGEIARCRQQIIPTINLLFFSFTFFKKGRHLHNCLLC